MAIRRVLLSLCAALGLLMAPAAHAVEPQDVTVSIPGVSVTLLPFAMPQPGKCTDIRARITLADAKTWKRVQVSMNDRVRASVAYENWSPKQIRKARNGILPLRACADSWYNRVSAEWVGPVSAQMNPLLPGTVYEVWLVVTAASGQKIPARTTLTTPG